MTLALCFRCGEIKFGAWVPCQKCHGGPSGNKRLDLLFSDHHFAPATLEALGRMIMNIRSVGSNDVESFWTFMEYISRNYPQIIVVSIPEEFKTKVADLLAFLELPRIELRSGQDASET